MAHKHGRGYRRYRLGLPWWGVALALVVAGGAAGALMGVVMNRDAVAPGSNTAAEQWAAAHWQTPIPLQGEAPAAYAEPATGIAPRDCAKCHMDKWQEWQGSRHAMAMGPGVVGQFHAMAPAGRAQCLRCHAPMAEQWAALPSANGYAANPAYRPELAQQGLVCAACHLRQHVRHGPTQPEGAMPASAILHGEPERSAHFESAALCKGCHQHDPATTPVINGKPVENTYQEWLDSPYAEQGVTCQDCHMPDRRHAFRGIHDPETTRAGVTVTTRVTPEAPGVGDAVTAVLTVANTDTGHAFPTYTTPAVYLRAAFLNAQGQVLPGGYFAEKLIQRRLDMSTAPWTEQFDTRLLPGEAMTLTFERTAPPQAASLYLWVWVEPDHFYEGFFSDYVQRTGSATAQVQIRQALAETRGSAYPLYRETVPLRGPN